MTGKTTASGKPQANQIPSSDVAALLLPNAVSARFGQDSVLWAIIGSFWSTNAILLVALGATGAWAADASLVLLICLTGLFVSGFWLVMQAAALRRVIYYEELTTVLESALSVPECLQMFGSNPEATTRGLPRLPKARTVMPMGPYVALFGWGLGTVFAFINYV